MKKPKPPAPEDSDRGTGCRASGTMSRLRKEVEEMTDSMITPEMKMWAFNKLEGWGVRDPSDDSPLKFRQWTFQERMAKADELVAWLVAKPEEPGS